MVDSDADPWGVTDPVLFREVRDRALEDQVTVLATVVDVEGSAYRRPGAKMAIFRDGTTLGAVTAGCLEGPVVDIATEVIEDGRPRVETFDLTDDDQWGLGLGCNGIVDILFEPVDDAIVAAIEALEAGTPAVTYTVVESAVASIDVGANAVTERDGSRIDSMETGAQRLPDSVLANVGSVREHVEIGEAATVDVPTTDGDLRLFVDSLEPAPRLVLFGTQHDVRPVGKLAREAGFEVVAASARGARADSDEFPYAHTVVTTRPAEIAAVVDSRTYVVLMSHNLLDDALALESLLMDTSVPYVGLMGPRGRFDEIRQTLAEDGTELTRDQIARVSTPVGLDLGGGEPMQIALSIVSEVLAVSNDRTGGPLGDRDGPIHERARPENV